MGKYYRRIIHNFPKVTLSEERHFIAEAQKGSEESRDELVLSQISFLIFRIRKRAFPDLFRRFGEDLLEEASLIVYKKVETYNLNYCDKDGNPKLVKFISYIWKRIDGFIIDYLRKDNYYHSSHCTASYD